MVEVNQDMKTRHRVALYLLVGAALLLAARAAWSLAHRQRARAFLPPAGESLEGAAPLRFAVVGDSRGNSIVFEEILASIKQEGVGLIIHTGDIVKRCTEQHYEWVLHELEEEHLSVPLCAVPGNHDVTEAGAHRSLLYERAFGPRRYWFSYGETLFVALGCCDEECPLDDLEWLERTLGRHRSSYTDCFVFTHFPPYDPRRRGVRPRPGSAGEKMLDVLQKHNVTALFASHIHAYLEGDVDGIPLYITGGAGADRDEPMGPFHYLLCTVEPSGKLEVGKVDVPDHINRDYPEYAFMTKFPVGASLVGVGVLLLAGIFLGKDAFLGTRVD